jgi:serine/threonine-protein kinase
MSESKRPRHPRTNDWFEAEPTVVNADFANQLAEQRYGESRELGMGGMGRVALVRDVRIGRDVAVKELRLDRELTAEDRARFLREARVQGQLEHPSIVPVYDIDQRPDGAIFFTMRRVVGRTLQEILDDLRDDEPFARARFTQRELLTAFATICLAVDYAHTRGVVHRDLKPANLMLGDFGEVYVLDWGVARVLSEPVPAPVTPPRASHSQGSVSTVTVGTPLYMAPEQMLHPDVGPEADVFALGAILFELLTLQELRTEATLYEPANAHASTRAPELDIAPELEAICVRATETRISARFATPRALQEAIARYLNGDRELEQRRALAGDHSIAAHKALVRANAKDSDYEQERGVAMRELVRALALDPTNEDLVGTLGRVLAAPPRTVPPEVAQDLEASDQELIHAAMRHSAAAFVAWLVFVPIVFWMGVHDAGWLAVAIVPVCVTSLVCYASSRLAVIPVWVQLVVIGLNVICGVAAKGMFGPLIMVPTVISTIALVVQAHTSRSVRIAGAVFAIVGMAAPVLLELGGWISPSYEFSDHHMIVLPQMLELHATQTNLLILATSVLAFVIPGIFIYRLRDALADAQRRLRMQTWHLSRIGEAFTRPANP